MVILERTNGVDVFERERCWIRFMYDKGEPLLNVKIPPVRGLGDNCAARSAQCG